MNGNDSILESLPFTCASEIQQMLRDTVSLRERNIASRYLADTERELEAIQVQDTDVGLLQRKRGLLESRILMLRSLLSPIRRLPPEVLTMIFLCGVKTTWFLHITRQKPTILSFSSVCGRWRDVILSSPILWSHLRFEIGSGPPYLLSDDGPKNHQHLRLSWMVRLFLERSKNAPLTLELYIPFRHSQDRDAEELELVALFLDSVKRCTHLTLLGRDRLLRYLDFQPLSGLLSSLQHLTIDGDDIGKLLGPVDSFKGCSSLTSLYLDQSLSSQWSMFPFPWNQITKLDLTEIMMLPFVLLLRECPRLEQLVVLAFLDRHADHHIPSPIPLPHLNHLTICSMLAPFLRHLLVPRLSSFCLRNDVWDASTEWSVEPLLNFGSSHVITYLDFQPPHFWDEADALRLLERFGSLEILRIVENRTSEIHNLGFYRPLITVTPLLPRLHTLETGSLCSESSSMIFRALVAAAQGDHSGGDDPILRSLRVVFEAAKYRPDPQEVKNLEVAGLRVDVLLRL
ncbi:hypothetical protein V5O48_007896 [Marasmius crinis-equi]|uniref:F-box domain-containing protein n=1 Tax=Marasmius crinis-equi TaxID=585013 RepID=A0ABR3FFD1_9AGAR